MRTSYFQCLLFSLAAPFILLFWAVKFCLVPLLAILTLTIKLARLLKRWTLKIFNAHIFFQIAMFVHRISEMLLNSADDRR